MGYTRLRGVREPARGYNGNFTCCGAAMLRRLVERARSTCHGSFLAGPLPLGLSQLPFMGWALGQGFRLGQQVVKSCAVRADQFNLVNRRSLQHLGHLGVAPPIMLETHRVRFYPVRVLPQKGKCGLFLLPDLFRKLDTKPVGHPSHLQEEQRHIRRARQADQSCVVHLHPALHAAIRAFANRFRILDQK